MYTERDRLVATLKRRHNVGRMIECFSVMLITLGAGAIVAYITATHHWDPKGRSLALSGTILAILVVWLAARKAFAVLPVHPYDHEFADLADKMLEEVAKAKDNAQPQPANKED